MSGLLNSTNTSFIILSALVSSLILVSNGIILTLMKDCITMNFDGPSPRSLTLPTGKEIDIFQRHSGYLFQLYFSL